MYNDIVDVCTSPWVFTKQNVHPTLYISWAVLEPHDINVTVFLASMRNNGELVAVRRMHPSLIEE